MDDALYARFERFRDAQNCYADPHGAAALIYDLGVGYRGIILPA